MVENRHASPPDVFKEVAVDKEFLRAQSLAERLGSDIVRLGVTGQLPNMARLALRYGSIPQTVSTACKILQEQGLVEVRDRKGTFVNEKTLENLRSEIE